MSLGKVYSHSSVYSITDYLDFMGSKWTKFVPTSVPEFTIIVLSLPVVESRDKTLETELKWEFERQRLHPPNPRTVDIGVG